MKTSTVKIALLLGVLMAFLAGTAYADTISATISVMNAEDQVVASVTVDDSGNVSGTYDTTIDNVGAYAQGVGVYFGGQIGSSGIYATTSFGLLYNGINGMPAQGNDESQLVLGVLSASCTTNAQNVGCAAGTKLVITLTDTGATIPQGSALFSGTLAGTSDPAFVPTITEPNAPISNFTNNSNVTVQSSVSVDGTTYGVFGNPQSTTTGAYTNAIGPFSTIASGGTVSLPGAYTITDKAVITYSGDGSAGFGLSANVDGCIDTNQPCNNTNPLAVVNAPEPTSLLLLGSSLVGLGFLRLKYRRTL